jgi:hypothetical protein
MPKLTREKKQLELNRHRDILFATIDYILQQTASEDLLKDQVDALVDYYGLQKQQIEKYFQKHRLDKLQQRLHSLTMFPLRRVDLTFNDYIRRKTSYQIDIFENLEIRIEEIISQNQITNKEQLNDIATMLEFYKKKSVGHQKADILKDLVINYANQKKTINGCK